MSIFYCASHGHQEDSDYVGCVDLGDGRAVCTERATERQDRAETAPAPATPTFCPTYEKDGNEFIVLTESFVADNHEDAWKIGLGSMLVECILLRMKYTAVREIDREHFPHARATINGLPVAVFKGPLFDALAHARPAAEGAVA